MAILLEIKDRDGRVSYEKFTVTGEELARMINADYLCRHNEKTGQMLWKGMVGIPGKRIIHLMARSGVEEIKHLASSDGINSFAIQLIGIDEERSNRIGVMDESCMFIYELSSTLGFSCVVRYLYEEEGKVFPMYFFHYENKGLGEPVAVCPMMDDQTGATQYFYEKVKDYVNQIYNR